MLRWCSAQLCSTTSPHNRRGWLHIAQFALGGLFKINSRALIHDAPEQSEAGMASAAKYVTPLLSLPLSLAGRALFMRLSVAAPCADRWPLRTCSAMFRSGSPLC